MPQIDRGGRDVAIVGCVGVLGSVHTRAAARREVPAAFHCHLLNHEDKGMMAKILFQ
jgi:FtsP/CotA-like multicopper oxidase with cupredoxin domain